MSGEFGTGKTIFVLAIVVGCFAVLWPKIFYPMLTASVTSPSSGRQEGIGPHARPERPPHLYPEMMHPALREKGRAMPQRTIDKQARPGPMPGVRPPMGGAGGIVPPPQTKGSGAMGIIMPLYTVGIVVFFVYTIMKVLFKKGQDEDKTPKLKDFGLDPEYRKYVFAEEYLDNTEISTKDQMRRQAREESRNRKKNNSQTEVPPDTKIAEGRLMDQGRMDTQGKKLGKSECEKKLDQFSNEIEARKKKKLDELARLIELEKEERRQKEEEGTPNPQYLDEDEFLDALTTEATYEREKSSSSSSPTCNTKSFPSHLHNDFSDADTIDRDADDFQSTNTNTSESTTSLDTDTTIASLGTDDLSVLPENEKDTPMSDPITQISATQLVKSNIPPVIEAVSEPQIHSNSLVQVYEASDISMQTCVPNVVCQEPAPYDVQSVNVDSMDTSSDQPLTTNSTPTPPTSVIPSSTSKITNHISTSLTSNRQNVHSKEIYSNKQSPQPQVPQQYQNTNFSNVPTKKVKHSTTPCNITQQQCPSAPNNKHKNKRKRSRKRGKKRGGSTWPSSLSINPVINRVEEVGEMTSEEDLTSSEALTTTLSEDTSLPASLQRHLEEIQKNEDSPTSSKGSSPDMDEYEVITKEEDHTTTATKEKNLKEGAKTAKIETKMSATAAQKVEETTEVEEEEEEEEVEEEEEEEVEEIPKKDSATKRPAADAAAKSAPPPKSDAVTEETSDDE